MTPVIEIGLGLIRPWIDAKMLARARKKRRAKAASQQETAGTPEMAGFAGPMALPPTEGWTNGNGAIRIALLFH